MNNAKSPIRVELFNLANPQSLDYGDAINKAAIDGYEIKSDTTSQEIEDHTGVQTKNYITDDQIHAMTGV